MNPNKPIGIFDSGIGGLTVASAIHKLMPNENIIYFGDTLHLPYGDKSAKAVREYALGISDFLIKQNCKAIVIACNTASAYGYSKVKAEFGKQASIFNVIDPTVNYINQKYSGKKIGVIGTKGTVKSNIYKRKIEALKNKTISAQLATPLLAPMIEEGYFNNYISQTIINSYLQSRHLKNIDALILGCTHYPLIKKEVKKYYKSGVEVVDSASVVAKAVKDRLQKKNLLNSSLKEGKQHFYISDKTDSFLQSAKVFFGESISLVKKNIWK